MSMIYCRKPWSFVRLSCVLISALGAGCVKDEATAKTDGGSPSEQPDAAKETRDASASPDANDEQPASKDSLLPLNVGNTWTYQVTDDTGVVMKVVTVDAEEVVGGSGPNKDKMGFRMTTKKGASDQTISWQGNDGDKVIRYREQSFGAKSGMLTLEEHWNPYKLHVDGSAEHTTLGASWLETYDETKIPTGGAATTENTSDQWTVDGVDVSVTVPAGTFKAIVLQKAGGSTLKTYWYVPGVGKVKETGGQTEELTSYKVTP